MSSAGKKKKADFINELLAMLEAADASGNPEDYMCNEIINYKQHLKEVFSGNGLIDLTLNDEVKTNVNKLIEILNKHGKNFVISVCRMNYDDFKEKIKIINSLKNRVSYFGKATFSRYEKPYDEICKHLSELSENSDPNDCLARIVIEEHGYSKYINDNLLSLCMSGALGKKMTNNLLPLFDYEVKSYVKLIRGRTDNEAAKALNQLAKRMSGANYRTTRDEARITAVIDVVEMASERGFTEIADKVIAPLFDILESGMTSAGGYNVMQVMVDCYLNDCAIKKINKEDQIKFIDKLYKIAYEKRVSHGDTALRILNNAMINRFFGGAIIFSRMASNKNNESIKKIVTQIQNNDVTKRILNDNGALLKLAERALNISGEVAEEYCEKIIDIIGDERCVELADKIEKKYSNDKNKLIFADNVFYKRKMVVLMNKISEENSDKKIDKKSSKKII